ncbi:PQQ-binding-like beta-propeller repeat protein [Actinoplanes sp. N902-109]|uniref:outer membrane protein assembly factor BamB family protein n=1 Tax=Actinoplanes sp. (strain N902-109) TaxID=649831 RepID=UPI00032966E8|nr:PQQ-binding-like beta-propeller repeat protein [Actinoplanes sp. N902-109]AGL18479.1 outer membrane protein assembly complex subunit YfgL [Actinoplanes sp. N902-109]
MFFMRYPRLGLAAAAMILLAPVTPAAAAPAAAWSQDGYDAGHTFYNPAEAVINSTTIGKLRTRWSVTPRTNPGGCALQPVAPVVVGARMFLLDPYENQVGAYDTTTGRRLWTSSIGFLEATGLAVADGKVVVSDEKCFSQSSDSSNLVALDVADGSEVWSTSWVYSTDMFVVSGGAVVTSGHCSVECDPDDAHAVAAWRLSDGAMLWERAAGTQLAGPVVRNGQILLTSTELQGTSVVDAYTGNPPAKDWHTGIRYTVSAADPVLPQYYVHSSLGLRAVHATTGRILWTVRNETGDLATDGRRVYVASAGRIATYDARTGRKLWTRALATPGNLVRAGGLLYATSRTALLVLAPTSGTTVRTFGTATEHVTVAGGRLFVTNRRTVRAYTP